MRGEPCMCGAQDCPSCGRAQGYDVRRLPNGRTILIETQEEQDAYDLAWENHNSRLEDIAEERKLRRDMGDE